MRGETKQATRTFKRKYPVGKVPWGTEGMTRENSPNGLRKEKCSYKEIPGDAECNASTG